MKFQQMECPGDLCPGSADGIHSGSAEKPDSTGKKTSGLGRSADPGKETLASDHRIKCRGGWGERLRFWIGHPVRRCQLQGSAAEVGRQPSETLVPWVMLQWTAEAGLDRCGGKFGRECLGGLFKKRWNGIRPTGPSVVDGEFPRNPAQGGVVGRDFLFRWPDQQVIPSKCPDREQAKLGQDCRPIGSEYLRNAEQPERGWLPLEVNLGVWRAWKCVQGPWQSWRCRGSGGVWHPRSLDARKSMR